MPENTILVISTDKIVPPYLMLRVVDRRSLDYIELRDSIAAHGILSSLTVRESPRFPGKYELIAGMYRLACAKDLGLPQVPCILVTASDEEALIKQVEENMQRPPTKRADFAMHLKRLFAADPDLTFEALSARIHKNPGWIRSTLKLTRLCQEARQELSAGNLTLIAAYAMCRLPQRLQLEFLPKAVAMSGKDAAIQCNSILKDYTEKIAHDSSEKFYEIHNRQAARLRTLRAVKTELEKLTCGLVMLGELESGEELTPLKVWRLALVWVLQLDTESAKIHAAKQQAKIDKMEQQIIERRKKRVNLKSQKDLELSNDWRFPLIDQK